MRVLLSPQRSDESTIEYTFAGEKITARIGDQVDEFDFSTLPEGMLASVETILPVNPILSARRENGVLSVELLRPYRSEEATPEILFPQWQEVS